MISPTLRFSANADQLLTLLIVIHYRIVFLCFKFEEIENRSLDTPVRLDSKVL